MLLLNAAHKAVYCDMLQTAYLFTVNPSGTKTIVAHIVLTYFVYVYSLT